jgi:hypothetical protein
MGAPFIKPAPSHPEPVQNDVEDDDQYLELHPSFKKINKQIELLDKHFASCTEIAVINKSSQPIYILTKHIEMISPGGIWYDRLWCDRSKKYCPRLIDCTTGKLFPLVPESKNREINVRTLSEELDQLLHTSIFKTLSITLLCESYFDIIILKIALSDREMNQKQSCDENI